MTGRPPWVFRKFGLCRNKIRELAFNGEIPGVVKAAGNQEIHGYERSDRRHADRIRNAQLAEKASVSMPSSKVKVAIAAVVQGRGLCRRFSVAKPRKTDADIALKYYAGRPVIERIERVSSPVCVSTRGLRRYSPS